MSPTFTVLTATFNRAHTLSRVWESLRAQTFRDFEWVVVDDGSSDGTEAIVQGWASQAAFPVVYLRQENKGKHVAMNRGVAASSGAFIAVLDSDDACVPEALARFDLHWRSIPPERRNAYYAVVCHCMDPEGRRIGGRFPDAVIDAPGLDSRYRWKAGGEKWGTVRGDLMRAMPFPERPERIYMPESIVWDRMAIDHLARFVNENLRIYHVAPGEGSLGSSGDPARNAWGSMLQHRIALDEHLRYLGAAPLMLLAAAAHYIRFSRHAGVSGREQRQALTRPLARALWWIAAPAGYAAWAIDRSRRWTSS
jgi:glycosyltransferase involved in cell wall biosynthesis